MAALQFLPRPPVTALSPLSQAVEHYRAGKFVIIVDDEDRENEGDLTMAAQFVRAEHINFMARRARGLVCISMTADRIAELGLPMMVPARSDLMSTPFTVTVDAAHGTTTGVSAADRARTVEVLLDPATTGDDLVAPGHLFPLRARDGGVLEREGQTEAAVDLARLAGLYPAAVLCEVMRPDGAMARLPDLRRFGRRHGIAIISVEQLIAYRIQAQG